jgi:hypothetical protein
MSTNLKTTTEPHSTEPTTEITTRGRSDPWAAPDEGANSLPSRRAQRQFEPTARARLRNLADPENAYSG